MSFLRNSQTGKLRLRAFFIGLLLFAGVLVFLIFRPTSPTNYLVQEGFISPNAPLLMNDSEMGLREEQDFIVMNLTSVQAVTLVTKFKTQAGFSSPIAPTDMPPMRAPNVLWNPQTVKKYQSGSFERKTGTYDYYCRYILDTSKPGANVLYFYANSPFYD